MSWKPATLVLIAAAAAAIPAPAPADSGSITKTEIRSDPPAITDRRLRDMIWDMFEHQDLRTREAPQAQLGRLWFNTRPVATRIPNLCRYDSARIEFAPIRHGSKPNADTPVRPVGITAQSHFHFVALPPLEEKDDEGESPRILPTDGPCASLDTSKTNFFDAPAEGVALDGYRAFLKLQQALREKKLLPLNCDLYPADKQSCADIILGLSADGIGSVDECDAGRDEDCFKILSDNREIRIVLNQPTSEQERARPIRASLDSMIVIADRLID